MAKHWDSFLSHCNSLFNCFNTPTFSLILLICLALDSSFFIRFHSAKSSSSRSVRSYNIVSGWMSWTMLSGSKQLGRAKKYCWSSASSSRWTIGSRIAMFHFFGTCVHSGTRAENIDYRILMVSKGFKLSETRYLAICSDHIWSVALQSWIDLVIYRCRDLKCSWMTKVLW